MLHDLHPELAACLRFFTPLGQMIDHPLVRVAHIDKLPNGVELANNELRHKQAALEDALSQADWHSYVFLHERPYRFNALRDLMDDGCAELSELWPVVGSVWSDSENIRHYYREWREIWQTPCERKSRCMNAYERRRLKSLPPICTVFRGVSDKRAVEGFSWTLDRKRAEWFARRFAETPYVCRGTVLRKDIIAYFSGRKEREVIVLLETVKGLIVERIE